MSVKYPLWSSGYWLRGPGQVTGDEVLKKQEDNESFFENKYILEKTQSLLSTVLGIHRVSWNIFSMDKRGKSNELRMRKQILVLFSSTNYLSDV